LDGCGWGNRWDRVIGKPHRTQNRRVLGTQVIGKSSAGCPFTTEERSVPLKLKDRVSLTFRGRAARIKKSAVRRYPFMTVTLDLNPEVERRLVAQAHERGVSLYDYLQEIVTREARLTAASLSSTGVSNLSDVLLNSPFAGSNLNLERVQDYPRPTDLE
jgi:hypothetical protein